MAAESREEAAAPAVEVVRQPCKALLQVGALSTAGLVRLVGPPAESELRHARLAEIEDMELEVDATEMLVNCPVVPDGSTARERLDGAPAGLISGWYRGRVVRYFTFE